MIVAKTNCCECGIELELDDKYGWTKEAEGDEGVLCLECDEKIMNEGTK